MKKVVSKLFIGIIVGIGVFAGIIIAKAIKNMICKRK